MFLVDILKKSLENDNISDIILTSNSKPYFKINMNIYIQEDFELLTNEILGKEISNIMSVSQKEKFKKELELDFSLDLKGYSRFRVNVFLSKNGIGAVFRPIKTKIPNFKDLGLPEQLLKLIDKKHGLLLITGGVGSGKSTTLASLINVINSTKSKHIITIEDPIEFIHKNNKSLIEQREIGTNTYRFESGLKYALRQASDVIMLGEIRDLDTFRAALRAAETGNLVLATLHTSGAARTISRIIDIFPGDEKEQIKSQLSESLLGVVWQDLIKSKDGDTRVLASELLINNTSISNMIRKGLIHQIDSSIETGAGDGMYTMSANLDYLKNKGLI